VEGLDSQGPDAVAVAKIGVPVGERFSAWGGAKQATQDLDGS